MKSVASTMIIGAGAMAALQWSQIAYRLRLFFVDYKGERGVNHIGDGDFTLIYIVNALLLATAAFGLRTLWGEGRAWRVSGLVIGALNFLGCVTLFVMHRTGILVEYSEFIRNWKGGV